MKSRIIVKCSCGKEWADDNTPDATESWWKVLDIVDPDLSKALQKKGDEKTLEMALRLSWARHSAYRREQGDKNPHEATVNEEITIETPDELEAMKEEQAKCKE